MTLTFEQFKEFVAEDENLEYFSLERLYSEYLEDGYYSYTTKSGLMKEAY